MYNCKWMDGRIAAKFLKAAPWLFYMHGLSHQTMVNWSISSSYQACFNGMETKKALFFFFVPNFKVGHRALFSVTGIASSQTPSPRMPDRQPKDLEWSWNIIKIIKSSFWFNPLKIFYLYMQNRHKLGTLLITHPLFLKNYSCRSFIYRFHWHAH